MRLNHNKATFYFKKSNFDKISGKRLYSRISQGNRIIQAKCYGFSGLKSAKNIQIIKI